ncbi:Aste57867_22849 [Aphanomyces stellatus]|uniref:Aste57867_22849 protein n=1 Tax=Aphanomyces stellatus TaxID=120398 RepID=A0A485LL24_9STRA|nr:hypothetical protein As57867_022778 [Aphanomyces stellatus]VFT99500.1 Aste57867_22849 [Aphanomyces stellatus]
MHHGRPPLNVPSWSRIVAEVDPLRRMGFMGDHSLHLVPESLEMVYFATSVRRSRGVAHSLFRVVCGSRRAVERIQVLVRVAERHRKANVVLSTDGFELCHDGLV